MEHSHLYPSGDSDDSGSQQPHHPAEATLRQRARTKVRVACVNCKKAHASCSNSRPCRRCVRLNLTSTCVDAQRKRRGRKRVRSLPDSDGDSRDVKRRRIQSNVVPYPATTRPQPVWLRNPDGSVYSPLIVHRPTPNAPPMYYVPYQPPYGTAARPPNVPPIPFLPPTAAPVPASTVTPQHGRAVPGSGSFQPTVFGPPPPPRHPSGMQFRTSPASPPVAIPLPPPPPPPPPSQRPPAPVRAPGQVPPPPPPAKSEDGPVLAPIQCLLPPSSRMSPEEAANLELQKKNKPKPPPTTSASSDPREHVRNILCTDIAQNVEAMSFVRQNCFGVHGSSNVGLLILSGNLSRILCWNGTIRQWLGYANSELLDGTITTLEQLTGPEVADKARGAILAQAGPSSGNSFAVMDLTLRPNADGLSEELPLVPVHATVQVMFDSGTGEPMLSILFLSRSEKPEESAAAASSVPPAPVPVPVPNPTGSLVVTPSEATSMVG